MAILEATDNTLVNALDAAGKRAIEKYFDPQVEKFGAACTAKIPSKNQQPSLTPAEKASHALIDELNTINHSSGKLPWMHGIES